MEVSVFDSTPNSVVSLHYISNLVTSAVNIGRTDSRGNFTANVSSGNYHILGGTQVYAVVDNKQTTTVVWPNFASSGDLSFSPSGLSLTKGQIAKVVASTGSNLYVVDNTNPGVATITISDSQITVSGGNSGSTNITICARNIGCNILYVAVDVQSNPQTNLSYVNQTITSSQSSVVVPEISFSQSSTTLEIGQSRSVNMRTNGDFGISNNSNMRVAIATVENSSLKIKALSSGTTNIGMCAVGSVSMTCTSFIVNVPQPQTSSASTTNNIYFLESDKNIVLNIGQTRTIIINGQGGYSISQNSGPVSVSASIVNNLLYINAVAPGGSNITICHSSGQCSNVYIYVNSVASTNQSNNKSTPASTPKSNYTFNKYLYMGMTKAGVSESEVVSLQNHLKTLGLYAGPITGYFGPTTKKAVEAYQKKNGLSALGVVGPSTRTLLNQGK
jgi:hypothetical protein